MALWCHQAWRRENRQFSHCTSDIKISVWGGNFTGTTEDPSDDLLKALTWASRPVQLRCIRTAPQQKQPGEDEDVDCATSPVLPFLLTLWGFSHLEQVLSLSLLGRFYIRTCQLLQKDASMSPSTPFVLDGLGCAIILLLFCCFVGLPSFSDVPSLLFRCLGACCPQLINRCIIYILIKMMG